MIVPDHFQFEGLGINIPFSAQTAGGAAATSAVTSSTDWAKVISTASDALNKAIDTGASAYSSIIRAKTPTIVPAPIYQQVPPPGYQQGSMAPFGLDTTTVILVAGGALVLLSLAFIVLR